MVPIRSVVWGCGGSVLIFAAGALTYRYERGSAASIPLYMLVTFLVAWRGGFRASILVAVASTIGLNYFFTEPRFTFRVASPQDVFTLTSFAGVSLLVSHLSNRIRSHAQRLQEAEEQQRALYELSRSALLIDWNNSIGDQFCALCQDKLNLKGVALWLERDAEFTYAGDAGRTLETLQASFRANKSFDLHGKSEHIRLLRFGMRTIGAIYFLGAVEPLMADAIATLVATHVERVKALKAEVAAASQAVSEQLRTAVLDGLAHAVKTPLTTILVSSSGLREIGELTPLQNELALVIQNQASHLATLTDKLLRTSKLEARDFILQKKKVDLVPIVESVLEELRVEHDVSRIVTKYPGIGAVAEVDVDLMRMAFTQLIENALKYSPGSSNVHLGIVVLPESLTISIHNEGSYIPPAERELVFERYYRSPSVEHGASGTGIGLSVTRKAVEAHSGRIWIESDREKGTTFHMSIPFPGDSL
jgi:two-component system sensor histidine kinase KdpD